MRNEGKQTELMLIVDLLALMISYVIAVYFKFGSFWVIGRNVSVSLLFFVLLAIYFAIFIAKTSGMDFCSRKASSEFYDVFFRSMILVVLAVSIVFFLDLKSLMFREFFIYLAISIVFLTFIFRMWLKSFMIHKFYNTVNGKRLVIVTTSGMIQSFLKRIGDKSSFWEYKIVGWILIDENPDMIGTEIDGFPVIGTYDTMFTCVSRGAVDEVFIYIPYTSGQHVTKVIEEYEDMGIKVNLNVNVFDLKLRHRQKEIRSMGNFSVISFSQTIVTSQMIILKRLMDIAGGIVGLILTGIITIFVAPPLLIESPGPLFFSQVRVGRNGRQFKIYKFRSMYKDAEERKKELMAQNEMNGLMFKMENDPRITKVGRFIRKFSIDELPQFWNVLKGDMSLVGTRPPTLDEFMQYESRYKRRLSYKPGITGLWQASGRSDIKDFEDVLALDLEYIDNWSLLLDIKLLIKTVYVAVFAKGAE